MSIEPCTRRSDGAPAEPRSAAIEAEHLVKTYAGGVRALSDLSFTVEPGAVFGLLGPNGAGKSTTVKILSTLSRADSGRAAVAGIDVNQDPDGVRRIIGVVSQKSSADREATGRENLMLQGRLYRMRGEPLTSRVAALLDTFGLANAARRIVRTYSGGMQRKLDVALGLVHCPEVLFLDEPTTGLDPEARAEMWKEVSALRNDMQLTILLTTHYLEEADHLAQRLAIVDRGTIVARGTPEELKNELHGDAIQVDFPGPVPEEQVRQALSSLDGIRDIVIEGNGLHAYTADGARAVPAVLETLERDGLDVESVSVARPSLDDVYLRYTGREYKPEGRAEKETVT